MTGSDPIAVRAKARMAVSKAIRKGTLIRPAGCQDCGRVGETTGHHPDYSRPLLVEWLCDGCHKARHPGRWQGPGPSPDSDLFGASLPSNETLVSRALAGYYRAGGDFDRISGVAETVDGRRYVVLRNVNGVLAVYRVRNDGMLKGLRRWPSELNN